MDFGIVDLLFLKSDNTNLRHELRNKHSTAFVRVINKTTCLVKYPFEVFQNNQQLLEACFHTS